MIERYTLPEMKKIWSEENKYRQWLEIEVLACEAMAEQGTIPKEAAKAIREKADFDVERIQEIEKITRHDVLAFLTAVAEKVGDESKYIHMGMTSSDILDTATALQLKEASNVIMKKLKHLREVLVEQAKKYKDVVMMGRSHGIHAEPITFGLKMALWVTEMDRNINRFQRATETISVGAISGAVGTFANIDPFIEEYVCEKLELNPAEVSTQIIQRDRHAEYVSTIAVVGSSLDKMATEIRNLQRTDVLEVEEMFAKGQKGSSAMPHKRNPIICERVAGLARVLRGNAVAALENVALWHERDLTHSSVERVILPDSTITLDYMLAKFIDVMKELLVYPDHMMKNVDQTLGLIFSQRVLLSLVDKGMLREDAYALVQRNAMIAWEQKVDFKNMLLQDSKVTDKLTRTELDELFDYGYHTKNVNYIFKRVGIE